MDIGIKFGTTQRGAPKLIDAEGYTYVKNSERKANGRVIVEYWNCSTLKRNPKKRCPGTIHYFPGSGEAKLAREHWADEMTSLKKSTKMAYDRLKELTLAAENGTKPIDIVNKMIEELPPERLEDFPHEGALIKRVQRYAKAGGVVLARNNAFCGDDVEGKESGASQSSKSVTDGELEKKKALLGAKYRIPTQKLALVDEEGRELTVPVDMIVTAGEDPSRISLDYYSLPRVSSASAARDQEEEESANYDDGNDFMDDGRGEDDDASPDGDGIPMDFDHRQNMKAQPTKAKTVSTSSKVKSASDRILKEAVKSGEKCFVCGDDILVSETYSSNQEIFRKACCYLNVKSESEWFPRKSNGQFYSFCELCTNEITRIQQLYRNVEEKQSLIFKKVAQLEKLITDSEILDNGLADAPSAKRLEGFRKQVMINYKNKLKLRREMRTGTKLGLGFSEIQPNTSAHMFASDPAETDAFRKTATTEGSTPTPVNTNVMPVKRGRGRPKSKKTEQVTLQMKPEPIHHFSSLEYNESEDTFLESGDFQEGFDHTLNEAEDDAMSVASEKERKFWEDDPSKLKLHTGYVGNNDNVNFEDDNDFEDGADNQLDSDYDVDDNDDDDEDWGKTKSKTGRSKGKASTPTGRRRGRPSTKTATSSSENEGEKSAKSKTSQTVRPKPAPKPKQPPTDKPKKKYHRANIEYPDVVLTKEGRMFLSGIEIIKNPPGLLYKGIQHQISYTCGSCGRVIVDFYNMKGHICGHHLLLYKCNECGKILGDARNLKRHREAKHLNTDRIPCHICQKPLAKNKKNMRYHIWHHLSEEEKKDPKYANYCPANRQDPNRKKNTSGLPAYQCQHCEKSFYRMDSLRKHELTHTGGESFQCQFCGKFYKNKRSYSRHNGICGNKNPAQQTVENQFKYPCPVCLVELKTPKLRRRHMRKFHGNNATSSSQPFACPKCPRRFQTRKAFQSHKRICVETAKSRAGSPQHNIQDIVDERSHSQLSTSDFKTAADPSMTREGHGGHHHQSVSMYSSEGSSPAKHPSNNPMSIPSSSSSALLSGYSYNLFGGAYPSPGNVFQSHHHHHHQ